MVFASDTRTNAGVDNIASFRKMYIFSQEGDRVIVMLTAGNLSITQSAIKLLEEHAKRQTQAQTIMNAESMYDVADLTGQALRDVRNRNAPFLQQSNIDSSASFIVGGQIRGEPQRLFHVYSEGNFIESTPETLYFQIGESKYGKPILDRVIRPEIAMSEAVKCMLVSFDSTIKSNLSVGLPIDFALVKQNQLKIAQRFRIDVDDHYFRDLRQGWGQGLRKVFNELPVPDWLALDDADQV